MSERPRVKIRGIYTTALSGMLKEEGFPIVRPSKVTAERFGLRRDFQTEDVEIRDKGDQQGVVVRGDKEKVEQVLEAIRKNLPHVMTRNKALLEFKKALERGESFRLLYSPEIELEFPAEAKQELDNWRAKFAPTLSDHHFLRILNSARVDEAEWELSQSPEKKAEIEEELKRRLIFDRYQEGKMLFVQHVKPDGEIVFLSEGKVEKFDQEQKFLLLRRWHYKGRGRYDGLNLPKEEGDYALTEAKEGSWVLKHSYFNRKGILKGEFYNVNTPIEFYPDFIRYVDLEVDVVRWPDGRVKLTDETDLREAVASGYIGEELKEEAMKLAWELKSRLQNRL